MEIAYNDNKILGPRSAEEVMQGQHLHPDHVRWELHRVWVVDAELAPGKRHSAPKGRYYFDEDSWLAVLGDRWDAKGQLWKTLFGLPMVLPEFPLMDHILYGFYDLISGAWAAGPYQNQPSATTTQKAELKDEVFTPDAMVGEQLR